MSSPQLLHTIATGAAAAAAAIAPTTPAHARAGN